VSTIAPCSSRSLSVAGFVLAGIAALLILAVKVGNMRLAPAPRTYSVLAEFHDADGLQVGAPAASAGVQVGTVSAIVFDQRRYETAHPEGAPCCRPFPSPGPAMATSAAAGRCQRAGRRAASASHDPEH